MWLRVLSSRLPTHLFYSSPGAKCIHQISLLNKYRSSVSNSILRQHCSTEPKKGINKPPKLSKPNTMQGGPISWRNLAATGIVFGILLATYTYAKNKKEEAVAAERKKLIGKARIGGGFDLIDQNGKPTKSDQFLGQWCLLYFGFTHCPDICPEELEKVAEVVDMMEKEERPVQPIFITVDPKRDGVKEVAEYVKEFHPKLIGLTGTEEQIKNACKSYRVYYSPGPEVIQISIRGFEANDAKMIKDSLTFHMVKYDLQNRKKILGVF
ncbi:protein SCO1 homolog, mitochondrial [Eurytemora carolleeae]|uniref:protein SCO1 homolog, mitochondrial n=1 Tax=Eurytemora carolleeae TaxID=1294199 RepID=UPI000C77772A|nr:protein SCO1 homolog, mitochondrial [Eurytemora carolleeae]|eukprot:XP_023325370.1 protein SCO1 homolog, mitochondrial-like [Eurytemora affinis]